MDKIIEATKIVKNYGSVQAVKEISFHVNQGECFGLLGPNGAGKTSTFRMVYGSSRIDSGELFVLGLNAKSHMKKIKTMLGVVPQENGLDPDFSVLDNLLIYASYFGLSSRVARERASELLGQLHLEEFAERPIDTLSGGMKRRLVLARALLTQPKVLMLDEPTTGLDPQARQWIWDQLLTLKKAGTTMILTTHYMEEAEILCDRIVIMTGGTVVAEGTPSELIETHVGREVVEFEVEPKEMEYFISRIQGQFLYQVTRNRLKLFIRNNQSPRDAINSVSSGNVTLRRASLNDVFLKISGVELHE